VKWHRSRSGHRWRGWSSPGCEGFCGCARIFGGKTSARCLELTTEPAWIIDDDRVNARFAAWTLAKTRFVAPTRGWSLH